MFSRPHLAALLFLPLTLAQNTSSYTPCPLLGPSFPPPTIDPTSSTLKSEFSTFTKFIDSYVSKGDGTFGPITPNTTSFSIGLFAGDNLANGKGPLFYEYHHSATESKSKVDKDTVYAAGDLTQIFTVLASLTELGFEAWDRSIVEFLPELESGSSRDLVRGVRWRDVTLGALAGHLGGIVRDSDACQLDQPCNRNRFLKTLARKAPVYLPDTTPVYSHAAFQLIAFAVEAKLHRPFGTVLQERILSKLKMSSTSLLSRTSDLPGLTNTSTLGEPASLSLLSSTNDLARFGHSLLTSSLPPAATTRRWLKPFTSTSNLANAVGRPWEIYHYASKPTNPIIDIYTKSGSVGRYSSYFGLSPDYDVGFSILAVNSEGEAPDLNAYADIVLFALLQIQELGRKEAQAAYMGTYTSRRKASSISLNATEGDPGLAVTHLSVNGTDWLSKIAKQSGIAQTEDLDFRLYPTNLVDGQKRAWQGVIQDKSALVDAGTPTCISWQTVGEFERNGFALDQLVIELGGNGEARVVESEALGLSFQRSEWTAFASN